MTTEVRHALDAVEAVLLKGGRDAIDLMNILSALRGPDSGNDYLKHVTTCPIRSMVFPRLWAHPDRGDLGGWFPDSSAGGWEMRPPSDYSKPTHNPDHFECHILLAKIAIDR